MFIVGFFSPKEKSGVTEMSLKIFHWLRDNTSLNIAFISNQKLERETTNEQVFDNFLSLPITKQIKHFDHCKKTFDVTIFDASSGLNKHVLSLLPAVDRLFVLGEENARFTEALYHALQFKKVLDSNSKKLINYLEGTYVLEEEDEKIGFTSPDKNIEDICNMIHSDYYIAFLNQDQNSRYDSFLKKAKSCSIEELPFQLNKLGIDFHKCLLFEKYVMLRNACGQKMDKAIENLLPLLLQCTFDDLLKSFQNELYVAQINFRNQESLAESEESENTEL